MELYAIGETEELGTARRHGEAFGGEIRSSHLCTGAQEVHRVGADAAADLEHFLALPTGELGKARNVGLDHIFPRLDLVEILARAFGLRRMADVARARIPIVAYRVDRNIGEAGGYRILLGGRDAHDQATAIGAWAGAA